VEWPDFSSTEWLLAIMAGLCAGFSKAGLAGLGMLTVMLMAQIIPGRASSGAVLPLLIFADVMAAAFFRQQILWLHIRRLAIPILTGIVLGCGVLYLIPDAVFKPVIGWMVLVMVALQLLRQWRPALTEHLPHSTAFLWAAGLLTGASTMIANAAGPIATIYLLLVGLPKKEFIATMAWLFLFVNLSKVPFSLALGLITPGSFALNVLLIPAVIAGLLIGRRCIERLPQKLFMWIILSFAALSAGKLIWFSDARSPAPAADRPALSSPP
jgi:uncharacterized membrane protein YfcA